MELIAEVQIQFVAQLLAGTTQGDEFAAHFSLWPGHRRALANVDLFSQTRKGEFAIEGRFVAAALAPSLGLSADEVSVDPFIVLCRSGAPLLESDGVAHWLAPLGDEYEQFMVRTSHQFIEKASAKFRVVIERESLSTHLGLQLRTAFSGLGATGIGAHVRRFGRFNVAGFTAWSGGMQQ